MVAKNPLLEYNLTPRVTRRTGFMFWFRFGPQGKFICMRWIPLKNRDSAAIFVSSGQQLRYAAAPCAELFHDTRELANLNNLA